MQEAARQTGTVSAKNRGTRPSTASYGSDLVVELLRALDIPYVALNPGASFRGLHDSLVNFAQGQPELILCLHEEIAVAMAHGYARATGRPMATMLHNIVGLQHGSMAIYNAWCDRIPVLVLGGTGPMDATKRRPSIDWVHTALVQGNQVRDYVKWDDQPASVEAFPESLLRGYRIAMTEPRGPVYLCFDVELQEQRLVEPLLVPDVQRFAPPSAPAADPEALREAAGALAQAQWPVIVADGVGRHPEALVALRELAELLAAPVIDRGRFNISHTHPLDLTLALEETLRDADVVLALDVYDLGGVSPGVTHDRNTSPSALRPESIVIHITLADLLQRSWAADYQRLVPVDIPIAADTAQALPELVTLCQRALAEGGSSATRIDQRRAQIERLHEELREQVESRGRQTWDQRPISAARLYRELGQPLHGLPWTMVNGRPPSRGVLEITEQEQFLGGGSHGGGLGFTAGASLGAALAYKGTGRLCISVIGDGEFLYTPSALWTAAHHQIPLLMIVFNNRTYYQDEGHQSYMARTRERPVENVGDGIYLTSPDADFATIARGFGVEGFGPVAEPEALRPTLERAIRAVQEGRPVLVDVLTQPR